jgi:hypothetical protein
VSELIRAASSLLAEMYDEGQGQFCYTVRPGPAGFARDFAHPKSIRYSINALLGLAVANDPCALGWDVPRVLDIFLSRHWREICSPADTGLLLEVLARTGHDATGAVLDDVLAILEDARRMRTLHAHDAGWLLSSLCRHALETGSSSGSAAADWLYRYTCREFINRDTLLPYFSRARWRRSFTTFGGLTYYLRSMADYTLLSGDPEAGVIFDEGVRRTLELQGPQGEWPWLINSDQCTVADWYPVYTTHQASMAMLFLLPALDRRVGGCRHAIQKSYRWLFGQNQLGATMLAPEPFQTYRSIRRPGERRRAAAFLRGLGHAARRSQASLLPPGRLEVNRECRSYEMGWILYAWAGRGGFEEFTGLQLAPSPP